MKEVASLASSPSTGFLNKSLCSLPQDLIPLFTGLFPGKQCELRLGNSPLMLNPSLFPKGEWLLKEGNTRGFPAGRKIMTFMFLLLA